MITTKGDITIEEKNLYDETLETIHFPMFQREYTWKKEHPSSILHDIITLARMDKSERAKKIVFLFDFIKFKENGISKYADGQQRSITINILITCINEYIIENKLPIPLLRTFDFKYENEIAQAKYEKFFVEKKRTTAPFAAVYKKMKKFVEDNSDVIAEIIEIIMNNLYVMIKHAPNVDVAYQMFAEVNTGGKPLTKDEVIKTTINQYSHKYGIPINYSFKDIKNFITSYQKFENNGVGNTDNFGIMSFLNDKIVKDFASFMAFNNYMQTVKEVNQQGATIAVNYLNKPQLMNVIYMLAINGIDLSKRRDYLEKVILPLFELSINWKIKKVNPGGVVQSLFNNILQAIKSGKSVADMQKIIMDFIIANAEICKIPLKEFSEGIGSGIDENAQRALLCMDTVLYNTSGNVNLSVVSLEHIYPQTPHIDWATNGWPGSKEEMDKIIHNIGNYILLPQSVNSSVKNKYITEKVVEYNKIIPRDKILQTPMNTVDFARFESEREKYVFERQDELAKHIQQHYPFGKALII